MNSWNDAVKIAANAIVAEAKHGYKDCCEAEDAWEDHLMDCGKDFEQALSVELKKYL